MHDARRALLGVGTEAHDVELALVVHTERGDADRLAAEQDETISKSV
jgi:hypothetical protein